MENTYNLRIYDENLITFSLGIKGLEGLKAEILDLNAEKRSLFPLDLELTPDGIVSWLEKRVIPKNRQFVDEILKTLGLSANDTKGIMDVCMGCRSMTATGSCRRVLRENSMRTISMKTVFLKHLRWLPIRARAEAEKPSPLRRS